MKKKLCILLTLCLTLCTVLVIPVQAAEEIPEEYSEDLIAPQGTDNGYYAGIVEDGNGYWYLITCNTNIIGHSASVSTCFALMDHRFTTKDEMNEYAKQVKGISSYGDVTTWNSATDSFGSTGFVQGDSYDHREIKTYIANVRTLLGRHGFGCYGYPNLTYVTNAY